MTTHNDARTVAAQQCGREPDAYEVRCTDGNYEWRRPYHGELEVIMRTGRDRSGKPFEYRALYAAVSPRSTITPAEVGGHADAQTEARASRAVDETGDFVMSIDDIATALAAKDADLDGWKNTATEYAAELHVLRAQLAEANKALGPFAGIADTEDAVGRDDPDDDRVWVVQAHGCQIGDLTIEDFRAARRARERGGENNG